MPIRRTFFDLNKKGRESQTTKNPDALLCSVCPLSPDNVHFVMNLEHPRELVDPHPSLVLTKPISIAPLSAARTVIQSASPPPPCTVQETVSSEFRNMGIV